MGTPKIKRMAILHRREGDDRAFFQHHWLTVHGAVVAGLPHLRSYLQNHVLEDFVPRGSEPTFKVDGFVEHLWDNAAEMQEGFRPDSEQVKAMLADEPNYIGHGTNYAMLYNEPLYPATEGNKLISIIRHRGDIKIAAALEEKARALPGCTRVIRDDVVAIIPKFGMEEPPVPVDCFLQIYFHDSEAASRAGNKLVNEGATTCKDPNAAIGLVRVRTETII
jgi:uncharacterized protein (TIGR02118 family)